MSKYYARAIEILSGEVDYREICFKVAAKHPKMFIEAAIGDKEKQMLDEHQKNINSVRSAYESGVGNGLIAAVKKHRELYGSSLKDAKDCVEEMRDKYGWKRGDE